MHTDPLFYRLFPERPELAFDGCGLLRRVYLSDLLEAEHLGFNARLARS
jgi:hypothetical protein